MALHVGKGRSVSKVMPLQQRSSSDGWGIGGPVALLPCPLDERALRHVLRHLSEFPVDLAPVAHSGDFFANVLCVLHLLFSISFSHLPMGDSWGCLPQKLLAL